MNTSFAHDGAIFLIMPEDQLTKLLTVAKIEIKS
jgi:hypothetical protein